eukprot:SAG11_NODE_623_length_8115_cov_51.423278_1_plen_97_part_00
MTYEPLRGLDQSLGVRLETLTSAAARFELPPCCDDGARRGQVPLLAHQADGDVDARSADVGLASLRLKPPIARRWPFFLILHFVGDERGESQQGDE